MTLFAGLMYVSGEGALVGMGFVLRRVLIFFIPTGHTKTERYIDYRERKINAIKKFDNSYLLVTGLIFLFIGIAFTAIWYTVFYKA